MLFTANSPIATQVKKKKRINGIFYPTGGSLLNTLICIFPVPLVVRYHSWDAHASGLSHSDEQIFCEHFFKDISVNEVLLHNPNGSEKPSP